MCDLKGNIFQTMKGPSSGNKYEQKQTFNILNNVDLIELAEVCLVKVRKKVLKNTSLYEKGTKENQECTKGDYSFGVGQKIFDHNPPHFCVTPLLHFKNS